MATIRLKAPFPWFGGKSRIAREVWQRFGDVPNFVEPFFGSGAVLLGRPHEPHVETVNDKDAYLANFWRATQRDPEAVASFADWPVNECDLHARHLWLMQQVDFRERMLADPDYYDTKIAGWWVWGQCAWIGSGWCAGASSWGRPFADGALAHQRLPHLRDVGMGVHRSTENDLPAYFVALATRLRRVRVCCGDWSRVLGNTPTIIRGLTGVFLDPPYAQEERDIGLYATDSAGISAAVREWAIAHGDNPLLRIALCGYEDEHGMPSTWECVAWKTQGGYGSSNGRARENKHRERIWFSSHCLREKQYNLLAAMSTS